MKQYVKIFEFDFQMYTILLSFVSSNLFVIKTWIVFIAHHHPSSPGYDLYFLCEKKILRMLRILLRTCCV